MTQTNGRSSWGAEDRQARRLGSTGLRARFLGALLCALLGALMGALIVAFVPSAGAQDIDVVLSELQGDGFYIEPGGDGTVAGFRALVDQAQGAQPPWYFASMAGPVDIDFADNLRDELSPRGNVIVYYIDSQDFLSVQLATGESESIEDRALASFDRDDWVLPEEFMADVVRDFDALTTGSSSAAASDAPVTGNPPASTTTGNEPSSGSSSPWPWLIGIGAVVAGGVWFSGRRRRSAVATDQLELAKKMRAEIQTQLDELANDVIVLSGPVDLSDSSAAIDHYRSATASYTAISDQVPDLASLDQADLEQLSSLGARVAQARWEMDAAEALMAGEPVPEQPSVAKPPAPAPPERSSPVPPGPSATRHQIPEHVRGRQPRQRTPFNRGRRSSGGALLDILIAGASMMGSGRAPSRRRRSGSTASWGRSRSTRSTSRGTTNSRSGRSGGVFGRGSGTRSTSRRSTSRSRTRTRSSSRSSRSRSRSRASSSRRSTSRRRRR